LVYLSILLFPVTYITIEVHNGRLLYRIIYNYMLLLVIVSCCHCNIQTCMCVWVHAHMFWY
jgi:hypothetical protein